MGANIKIVKNNQRCAQTLRIHGRVPGTQGTLSNDNPVLKSLIQKNGLPGTRKCQEIKNWFYEIFERPIKKSNARASNAYVMSWKRSKKKNRKISQLAKIYLNKKVINSVGNKREDIKVSNCMVNMVWKHTLFLCSLASKGLVQEIDSLMNGRKEQLSFYNTT